MDKDKFYKFNKEDMAIMKKINHHIEESMKHSTDSLKHKHHVQKIYRYKCQLSKLGQKLLMMWEGIRSYDND